MSTKWFDPRDLLFKSPFGAVPCGADVSFCFRPERGAAVTRCELLAHGEFADQWTTVELTPAQEDGHVVYHGIFTAPDDVELVWYHFRLSWADGGTSCYGKNGLCAWDAVEPCQLTVYDDTHKTPAWFGRGVTYQIFPDRFRRAKSRDVAGLVARARCTKIGTSFPNTARTPRARSRAATFSAVTCRGSRKSSTTSPLSV